MVVLTFYSWSSSTCFHLQVEQSHTLWVDDKTEDCAIHLSKIDISHLPPPSPISLSLSLSLSHTHSHTLTLSLSLSHKPTCTYDATDCIHTHSNNIMATSTLCLYSTSYLLLLSVCPNRRSTRTQYISQHHLPKQTATLS